MITHKHLKEIGFYQKSSSFWELGNRFVINEGFLKRLRDGKIWLLEEVGYWSLIVILDQDNKQVFSPEPIPKPVQSYIDNDAATHWFMDIRLAFQPMVLCNESAIYNIAAT